MNGHGTALQRCVVAGVVAGVLLGAGAGLPLTQGATLRASASTSASTADGAHARVMDGAFSRAPDGVRARASIVDGSLASITEFPFQVALYNPRLGPPAKGFFCGGVILDAARVATAAHCLIGEGGQHTAPAEIEVLAGSSSLASPDAGSVRDPVVATAIDPAYSPASSDYDVGVVRLARPLWSGATPALDGRSTIAPLAPDAPLANLSAGAALAGQTAAPMQATVSGWGDENAEPGANPSYPLRLRKARVPLVATSICEEAYATIEQAITPRMLCAGSHADSCYVDSGGPLVAGGTEASPAGDVLLGLVDFGDGCAQPGYPGVYVRVADPAVAAFLATNPAQVSAVGIRRDLCPRPVRRGHTRHPLHAHRVRAGGKGRCKA
jgi:secreted trypsin-like serine protease